MRERAAEIGAKLDIWSGAGTGEGDRFEHRRLDCLWEAAGWLPLAGIPGKGRMKW
jgi:hypothetical protein